MTQMTLTLLDTHHQVVNTYLMENLSRYTNTGITEPLMNLAAYMRNEFHPTMLRMDNLTRVDWENPGLLARLSSDKKLRDALVRLYNETATKYTLLHDEEELLRSARIIVDTLLINSCEPEWGTVDDKFIATRLHLEEDEAYNLRVVNYIEAVMVINNDQALFCALLLMYLPLTEVYQNLQNQG